MESYIVIAFVALVGYGIGYVAGVALHAAGRMADEWMAADDDYKHSV